MTFSQLTVFSLKYYIPAMWALSFRVVAFGYRSRRRVALGFMYILFICCVSLPR